MKNKNIHPAVSEFFRNIGKNQGKRLKAKYGDDYFKRIAAMRKKHGRQRVDKKTIEK